MKLDSIPLMPLPNALVKKLTHGFYPISSVIEKYLPHLDHDLEQIDSKFSSKEYISGALVSFTCYFVILLVIMGIWVNNSGLMRELGTRVMVVAIAVIVPSCIFLYTITIPAWIAGKKKSGIETNIMFATRHLMVQTSAGVPLFDALVSVSEQYDNKNLDYGEISREIKEIVKNVKSGKELTEALEQSAMNNSSGYYKKIMWQLSNASKSGADIGSVLKNMIEYFSDEQRIAIRNYGSQLSPLALFYMLTCIIAPTMGLVIMMIMSSFIDIPINEITFILILMFLVVFQVMFIGLIKSRRPKVVI